MKNFVVVLSVLAVIILIGFAIFMPKEKETANVEEVRPDETAAVATNRSHRVILETSKGRIIFETYDSDAPLAAGNFIKLAEQGFYDGLTFHRVIPGFMIQGGDPNGNGTGGPDYTFADELDPNTESAREGYKRGVVAMANRGPNTNGSQFFIMHADYPLPHNYTIFGKVVEGIETVDAIAEVERDSRDKPLTPVVINKINVEHTEEH